MRRKSHGVVSNWTSTTNNAASSTIDHKRRFRMYRNILVALNESGSARRALQRAIGLAAEFNATLTAITVVQALPPYAAYAAASSSEALQMIKRDEQDRLVGLLENARREATRYDIKVKTILSDGPVVATVVEAVRRNDIDLLVLGIHPEQGLLGWLTASTAHELAQKATCDLLGVR
jgi:nucleotide-binding universal stress UspA family protein